MVLYIASAAIIQGIERISAAGSAYLAYYFFYFKDTRKQDGMPVVPSPPSSKSSVVNLLRSAKYFMNYSQNINVIQSNPVTVPLNNASR